MRFFTLFCKHLYNVFHYWCPFFTVYLTIFHGSRYLTTFHSPRYLTIFYSPRYLTIFHSPRCLTIFHSSRYLTIFHSPRYLTIFILHGNSGFIFKTSDLVIFSFCYWPVCLWCVIWIYNNISNIMIKFQFNRFEGWFIWTTLKKVWKGDMGGGGKLQWPV